jgi:RNA polymerase-binding transcription factor DksA
MPNKLKNKNKNQDNGRDSNSPVVFPKNLLVPVKEFLIAKLKMLKKTRHDIDMEDPFKYPDRLDNNSPDMDAEEQYSHARTSAIRDEINRKIIQVRKALAMIKIGKYGICEECGKMIDTDRLMVYPETTLCTEDAKKKEG